MSKNLWKDLQRELERDLDPDEFATWFRPLRVQREDKDRLVLVAPNDHFVNALEQSYRPAVNRAIAGLRGPQFRVLFSLADKERPAPAVAERAAPTPPLDPRYVFDNFVVGNSNQFAHAAARAVAESPAHSYNPLFLYGGVGLGKTHLLHAIGHEIQRRQPGWRVLYLVAEQFVNELINSIRFERMPAFRERYRTVDVLLIDDVQFVGGKERTQEEFFHIFNALHDTQKQIVISSDCPPRQIPTLEERLHSRFEWGLIADIQPPDIETKVAILRKKAEDERVEMSENVALFIASKVKTNIRELEGSLIRLIAYGSLTGRDIDLPLAQEVLRDLLHTEDKPVSIEMIQKFVADHYNVKLAELKAKNNSKAVAVPRQIAMYLTKTLTHASLPEIGKGFGGKHHSTVIHSVRKIDGLRKRDPEFDRLINSFVQAFR